MKLFHKDQMGYQFMLLLEMIERELYIKICSFHWVYDVILRVYYLM